LDRQPLGMAKPTAPDWIAIALASLTISHVIYHGTGLKQFLTMTDKTSWAWEITAMGYMLKTANDNRPKVAGCYWAKALVMNGIASFGGGFIGPLAVACTPAPFMEETFVWMVVVAWYLTQHIPAFGDVLSDVIKTPIGFVLFSAFWGIFRTNQIVGVMELGAKAVAEETLMPHSRYFSVPIAAPLVCGWLAGFGGSFLPFTNGLQSIEESKGWPVRSAVLMPIVYLTVTRLFAWQLLDAKLLICLLRVVGDTLPARRRDRTMSNVTSCLYRITNVRQFNLPAPAVSALKKLSEDKARGS